MCVIVCVCVCVCVSYVCFFLCVCMCMCVCMCVCVCHPVSFRKDMILRGVIVTPMQFGHHWKRRACIDRVRKAILFILSFFSWVGGGGDTWLHKWVNLVIDCEVDRLNAWCFDLAD